MKIKGIAWMGIKTERYQETAAFFQDVLEISIQEVKDSVTIFRFPNGDMIEVYSTEIAPELGHMKGPKVDFLVEDVDEAVKYLSSKGHEIIGPVYREDIQDWANFKAPDGNWYGFTSMNDHPLHKEMPNKILFYGPHEPYGYLGNWYPAALFLKGKIWSSAEHYYQAQKMAGTEFEELCRRLSSPREAFEMTRRPDVPIRPDWEQVKVDVMREAISAKFSQNPELMERLLATGRAELIENSPVDSFWGVGEDGCGQNLSGKILMEIREKNR
jgi:N-glycosidase YbiA